MAQHDYVIANGTGAAVRSDLNNALAAIVSQNSGATTPSTTYAYQWWADTTTGFLKLRNSANSAWITLFQLDGEWSTIALENGTAAAPSIYFKDSGTDTGFYSPGANQVGISTGGTARLTIDANGNVDIDSNTLYVDATNNRVGLGTSSPQQDLHINDATGISRIRLTGGAAGADNFEIGQGVLGVTNEGFSIYDVDATANRLVIDGSGRVGIGTTSPAATLDISGNQLFSAANPQIQFNAGGPIIRLPSANTLAFLSDSTTERARIDSSGRLLVGTSSAFDSVALGTDFSLGIERANYVGIALKSNIANAVPSYLAFNKSRGTTLNSKTIVANNDELGAIVFGGADGTNMVTAAAIVANVDGTPGTNDMPGRLVFSTTADGASSPTERLRIAQNGAWGLAGANYGSSGQVLTSNGSGSAPTWGTGSSAVKAWVNFNGTGTVAIRASDNVSSITDNGVGRFRINMTTALADSNYVVVGSVLNSTTPGVNGISWVVGSDDAGATIGSSTTTSFHIGTFSYPTTAADFQYTQVAVFR